MKKPLVDVERNLIRFDEVDYKIIGRDAKQQCLIGEYVAGDNFRYVIVWPDIGESLVQGLSEENCLVLDHDSMNQLEEAVMQYRKHCEW